MKYVLVSGGVISGVGKGIIASSTALLLKKMGLSVTMIKIDPYMNIDAGTMSPTEHGEVFVLSDGGECDLDLGNYERYLGISLTREHNITTGKVYLHVIERERKGDYLGKTVQVVPHLTDGIQDWCERVAKIPVDESEKEPDVCVIELGGTVGDIENGPFVEAMRQLKRRAGKDNFLHIHVSLIPVINGEQKTKPTQQAIRDVRSVGLSPDLIACRCKDLLQKSTIEKVAMFCQVEPEQVVAIHDVPSTYLVPLVLEQQNLIKSLTEILCLDLLNLSPQQTKKGIDLWNTWKTVTSRQSQSNDYETVTIALVGKYTSFIDSYISVIKSLEHSAMACKRKLNLKLVEASHLEGATSEESSENYKKAWSTLHSADGILVPSGFGQRGTEGMILAAKYARENKKPYLGVCLGMQIAVIEYARNVCNLADANSVELDESTKNPVVIFMPEIDRETMGGTMRLGSRPTHFQVDAEWSKIRALYTSSSSSIHGSTAPSTHSVVVGGKEEIIIHERHRHRYEVNPAYIKRLGDEGLNFIGKDEMGERMEILELRDHPWFVGVQFHPEYLSRVLEPSRPYLGFLAASAGCLDEIIGDVVDVSAE